MEKKRSGIQFKGKSRSNGEFLNFSFCGGFGLYFFFVIREVRGSPLVF